MVQRGVAVHLVLHVHGVRKVGATAEHVDAVLAAEARRVDERRLAVLVAVREVEALLWGLARVRAYR